jgi:hypothetical protein
MKIAYYTYQILNGKQDTVAKDAKTINIARAKKHSIDDVLNADMMKVQLLEPCLIK